MRYPSIKSICFSLRKKWLQLYEHFLQFWCYSSYRLLCHVHYMKYIQKEKIINSFFYTSNLFHVSKWVHLIAHNWGAFARRSMWRELKPSKEREWANLFQSHLCSIVEMLQKLWGVCHGAPGFTVESGVETKDLILFIVFVLVNSILLASFKLLFSNYILKLYQDGSATVPLLELRKWEHKLNYFNNCQ